MSYCNRVYNDMNKPFFPCSKEISHNHDLNQGTSVKSQCTQYQVPETDAAKWIQSSLVLLFTSVFFVKMSSEKKGWHNHHPRMSQKRANI